MEPVSEWIRQRFPTVENVCSDTVEQLLKENRERVLLLDIRSPPEYEISHLPGAIRIDPEATNMDHLVKDLGLAGSMDKTVICYCTAGYHGSEMAQRIRSFLTHDDRQEGSDSLKVYNLEGGLAKWANERKAIVDSENQPTSLVHPYNTEWAQLLEPEFRAPI
ncbi:thiosulfate sulfurtransferase GlpE-like [Carcharodon carcharias]|uniref:thiosulfate sulfurtransferase GlpE-like n=1 Tax=Carcharodon carcharias TaxID=13397 RepID=UPI001B7E2919|nr:thiosulfate sulfurtransferase GlpE-like [Carcharodon carcharias]